jgi:hypothetical protein
MTEEECNAAEEQHRELILAMSLEEREAYEAEQEKALRPTDKEIAELDAYYNIIGGYLREYVEAKEKENKWFSKWKEHKQDENEDTYWEIEWNNQIIENTGINWIVSELELIIKQVSKNPSKELIERKIKRLEAKFNDFHNGLIDCLKFIITHIENENLSDLGHTQAWIYLDEYLESLEEKDESIKRKSKISYAPKWIKGDIERLIKQMKVEGFISKDYNDESIKDCFSGKPIKDIKPIEFINGIPNSTKAQLMHHIDRANLIYKSTQEEKAYIIGINKNEYKNTIYRQKIVAKISHIEEVRRIVRSVTLLIPN